MVSSSNWRMYWEKQTGRYPRDPRLGHRPGINYVPEKDNGNKLLKDLYTTSDGYVSLDSSNGLAINEKKKLILLLGGSTAMGLGASKNEKTIAAVLQNICDTYDYNKYCVVNCACAAYCSWQELLKFALELSHLSPYYVVSISAWNDFIHSSIGDRYIGRWVRNHDRSIDDLSDSLIGLDENISLRSLLTRYLSTKELGKRLIKYAKSRGEKFCLTEDEIRWGYYNSGFIFKELAVTNYYHNMRQLSALSCNAGAKFKCFVQPIPEIEDSDSGASEDLVRMGVIHDNFLQAREQFYTSLRNISFEDDRFHFAVLSGDKFVDHCHLNDKGQQEMAMLIFEHMVETA